MKIYRCARCHADNKTRLMMPKKCGASDGCGRFDTLFIRIDDVPPAPEGKCPKCHGNGRLGPGDVPLVGPIPARIELLRRLTSPDEHFTMWIWYCPCVSNPKV